MERAVAVVTSLKDSGYFLNVLKDKDAKEITEQEVFANSLLRESGANKAYQDGWRIFSGIIENQIFNLI